MHRSFSLLKISAAVAVFAGLGSWCSLSAQVTFDALPGVRFVNDISSDGSVVVGTGPTWGGVRFVRGTGAVGLGSFNGAPAGVSADGTVIVGTYLPTTPHQFQPFSWTEAGGPVTLTPLTGAIDSRAYGVSGDGATAVGFTSFSGQWTQATQWNGSTPAALPFLPGGGTQSMAMAISTDGSTIAGYAGGTGTTIRAVRWTDAGVSELGGLGGYNSLATAVSATGEFIAGYVVPTASSANVRGFVWSETGGKMDLSLAGQSVLPEAVSADGSLVIGYTQQGGSALGGFAWTPGAGMRDLQSVLAVDFGLADELAGWSGLYASAMTDDGRYWAGTGYHDGEAEGWVLDRGEDLAPIVEAPPPTMPATPEPATYGFMAAFILLGLAERRRRRNFVNLV